MMPSSITWLRTRWPLFISPVLVLLLWQWACQSGVFPAQVLISPLGVLESARELWASGELQDHLGHSLYRLALGFIAGSLTGLGFGVAMGLSPLMERGCAPLFHALRQVPTVAFIPMLILVFGVEESFKIVIVAQAAFFPVALATYDAVKGVSRQYLELARIYQFPPVVLVTRVILPATIPPVLTGFRLSLGRSWMVLVAAELLASDSGIGQMMEMGRQMFRIDVVMVGVVVTGGIGFLLDRGFRGLEAHLVRWKYR
jgi:sulfonate transport system permease protein